jgi:hypothetical protein
VTFGLELDGEASGNCGTEVGDVSLEVEDGAETEGASGWTE